MLNLTGLRSEGIVERVLGLVQQNGLSYADAMQMIVKGRYADLGDDWNIDAQWEAADAPKIVNWRRQARHFGHMALTR